MNTSIEPLSGPSDLLACERLQASLLDAPSPHLLRVPILCQIARSGGLLLGAWDRKAGERRLVGALVDLVARADRYPARLTVFWGVDPGARNRGAGKALRWVERETCLREGIDLVYWWGDPLDSPSAHVAFNQLGAIASLHERNALGPPDVLDGEDLATDRIRVEWWIDAPRVRARSERTPPQVTWRVGLDQMQVLLKTRSQDGAYRLPASITEPPTQRYALLEIPEEFSTLRSRSASAASAWRKQSRDALELLFTRGYTIVGLVHEGSRSFHLLERIDRAGILVRESP